jgi:Ca-activated chloride channel family protein
VNNAERRLDEVEERLRSLEAPEPPPHLLESLVEEIPEDLGIDERGAHRGPARWNRWRLLAASLAVVTVGGVLGYRLLEEEPFEQGLASPGIDEPRPTGPDTVEGVDGDPARSPAPRELGEVVVGPPVASKSSQSEEGPGDEKVVETASPPAAVPPVEEVVQGDDARERKLEIGERAADELDQAKAQLLERLAMLDSGEGRQDGTIPKPRVQSLVVPRQAPVDAPTAPPARPKPTSDPALDELERSGLESMRADAGELRRRLKRLPVATAEAPILNSGAVAVPSTGGRAEPNDEPYGDMFFQGYGTNPFVDTEDDALSTFGIDVDTASYTMARSYLRRGDLPPADAIRVEEFVNYFDYGDRSPRSRDFAVVAEGAPSPYASTARTHLLRFALKGREIAENRRKPAVLTFAVDVSGSMNRENRLGLVQRALRLLVAELDEGDAVGLVVYGSRGRVLLAPTNDHARVLAMIEQLRPGGSTNAEEGLVLAYETARDRFREGAINRVILCSDGVANVGATGPDSILRRIADEADGGIELTTVGFGMGNYNDVLMEQLADKGDGNYAYVDDLDAARRVFVENLTGTLQTIAGDAKIQVEFEPGVVQSYRLLGYENRDVADRDFRNDAVDAGEVGAGHQVTALYEVKLRDGSPERGRVATLTLRYRSKATGRMVEDSVELGHRDLAKSWGGASRGLRLAALVAEFAERLRGSYWARDTSLRDLAVEARELGRYGAWDSEIAELTELIEIAARLEGDGPARELGDGFER